jgi:hypothetical protein
VRAGDGARPLPAPAVSHDPARSRGHARGSTHRTDPSKRIPQCVCGRFYGRPAELGRCRLTSATAGAGLEQQAHYIEMAVHRCHHIRCHAPGFKTFVDFVIKWCARVPSDSVGRHAQPKQGFRDRTLAMHEGDQAALVEKEPLAMLEGSSCGRCQHGPGHPHLRGCRRCKQQRRMMASFVQIGGSTALMLPMAMDAWSRVIVATDQGPIRMFKWLKESSSQYLIPI